MEDERTIDRLITENARLASELVALRERLDGELDGLRRQVRRTAWRSRIGMAIAATVAGVAVAASAPFVRPARADAGTIMEALGYRVLDANGTERGYVGMGADGTTGLVDLEDSNKRIRLAMTCSPDGLSDLQLTDADGHNRFHLSCSGDGSTQTLQFLDAKGTIRSELSATGDGSVQSLSLRDADGKNRIALASTLGAESSSVIEIHDTDGTKRGWLDLDKSGAHLGIAGPGGEKIFQKP